MNSEPTASRGDCTFRNSPATNSPTPRANAAAMSPASAASSLATHVARAPVSRSPGSGRSGGAAIGAAGTCGLRKGGGNGSRHRVHGTVPPRERRRAEAASRDLCPAGGAEPVVFDDDPLHAEVLQRGERRGAREVVHDV